MRHIKPLMSLIVLCLVISCNQGGENETSAKEDLQTNNISSVSSSAAALQNDSTHQFIKKANLKFKVMNVIFSTYDIESIAVSQGGYVSYTTLESNIDNVSLLKISPDSSLETTHFTVSNAMTLRIPTATLDTTLKEIAHHIEFLDYRIIKADNIALQLLANNLQQKRSKQNEERLSNAIDTKGKKLNDISPAIDLLSNRQEKSDGAKLANLELSDQVSLSTVNILIYQRPSIKRELISNDKNIEEYEPGFTRKIADALQTGWQILETFFLFLVQIWALILLGIIAWLINKKYRSSIKK